MRASGTAPPNIPECTPWSRVSTVTTARTIPRSVVVSAGSPTSQLPESASTMASARSFSPCRSRIVGSESEPISSSPSTKIVTPTGRSSPCARRAARWAITPALSSAAPRPYSRPSRSVGSNGGLSHSASSPGGWTSWWA